MDFRSLYEKYQFRVSGLLHVGAHLAEEAELYARMGISKVWWVEANPQVFQVIEEEIVPFGHQLIRALVYSEDGAELTFNVTNYLGMSSSIFEFGTHPTFSPDTVFVDKLTLPTRTIDSLVDEYGIEANFLNMDLQGAELHALQGAPRFLQGVDYILTEVNNDEVYIGCARVQQLDEFLVDFIRKETHWVQGQGWGDALYVRTSLL